MHKQRLLYASQSSFHTFFLCKSDYGWLPVSGCGHASVCKCSELNKTRRRVSGEPVLEWAGLMCAQQTASDPSSACLNWAPTFIQCRIYLQYTALYESLLHRRPLQRGHCSSLIHTWMHMRSVHGHTLLVSRPVQRAKLGTKLEYRGVTGTDLLNSVHQTDQLCV